MVKNERTAGVLGSGDTFKQMCERIALKNIPMRGTYQSLWRMLSRKADQRNYI